MSDNNQLQYKVLNWTSRRVVCSNLGLNFDEKKLLITDKFGIKVGRFAESENKMFIDKNQTKINQMIHNHSELFETI